MSSHRVDGCQVVHLCISVWSQVGIETNGGLIRTDVGAFPRQYEGGVSNVTTVCNNHIYSGEIELNAPRLECKGCMN